MLPLTNISPLCTGRFLDEEFRLPQVHCGSHSLVPKQPLLDKR
ncbi:MAG: hypothetical protein ACI80L_001780 [Pseudohongiellaceae bacterium]|jgi:hypothetical protein